jgi:hypothetical protein
MSRGAPGIFDSLRFIVFSTDTPPSLKEIRAIEKRMGMKMVQIQCKHKNSLKLSQGLGAQKWCPDCGSIAQYDLINDIYWWRLSQAGAEKYSSEIH